MRIMDDKNLNPTTKQQKPNPINNAGFTLIELLISITLLSILLGVFTSVYVMGIKVYQREFYNANLQSENRIVLDRIVSDIKQASKVRDNSTATSLIIEIPSIDANDNILYEITGQFKTDTFQYSKSGNNLIKQVTPNASSSRIAVNKTILNKVSTLTFTYIPNVTGAKQVQINLITTDVASGKTITINNTSKVLLRNK